MVTFLKENFSKILDKQKAPVIAGGVSVFLACMKLVVGIFSGSMAVLSSAVDSMMDFLVSALNFFAIKKSNENPNSKFNYGFGKIEALMALMEGIFIILIGIFIFAGSIKKLIYPESGVGIGTAIYVMLFSSMITFCLVFYLNLVCKKTKSLIVKADALHYKTDLFTNLGIIISLVIIKVTGFVMLDAIIGILISVYIVYSAISLAKDGVYVLLDGALDDEIVKDIVAFIDAHKEVTSHHCIKTRKSGDTCFFGAHLVFDNEITLLKAHSIGDEVEFYIQDKYSKYKWVIDLHFDPEDDS